MSDSIVVCASAHASGINSTRRREREVDWAFMPARRREPLAREEPAELQVAATNGSIVTDSRGRKYIDFVMGWCVGNFGWRPAAIAKAIERFKGPDYVYPGYAYAPWTELARLLASLGPASADDLLPRDRWI